MSRLPISPWLVPAGIEVCLFVLFCAVLIHFRRSIGTKATLLWLAVWVSRAAASGIALHLVSRANSIVQLFYTPLQLAVAIAIIMIAFRHETQREQLLKMHEELTRVKREAETLVELDSGTGLLNRYALASWMDRESAFDGCIVVCDLDDFKMMNDVFGHMVGDEILHGVGQIIRGSIRHEDLAFRWGGDEIVIFFRNLDIAVVETRMRSLEERLQKFQIRNLGPLAIRFSWGAVRAETANLREALEKADQLMYENKRARRQEAEKARLQSSQS